MNASELDMTSGPLAGKLLRFSFPLICSNLLQVLFNLADVAVVGRFAGTIALGAVGSTTYLITLSTGVLLGMAAGINAVTARFAGARDRAAVRRSVHTAFVLCLAVGVLLLLAGVFLTGPILRLMKTKDELIGGASLYLTVYLLGSPALALYNYGSGVLSAIGDTKRPLRYLSIAGVLNIVLNLVFVILFHLDVLGVALASIFSQYVSAALILTYLLRCGTDFGLSLSEVRLDPDMASNILAIAVPSAIQYSLFAVANLFVQSAVNSFDHVVVEGNSAAANADNLVYDVMAAFYTACTSFTAQNYGAGKKDRIKTVFRLTTAYACAAAVIMGGLLILFRGAFLHLFTTDGEVLGYARLRLVIMSCSYWISAFMDNPSAAARGLGKSVAPTVITILGTVVYRIVWIYTVFAHFHTLPSLYLLFGTAWIFTSVIANIYLACICRRLPEMQ